MSPFNMTLCQLSAIFHPILSPTTTTTDMIHANLFTFYLNPWNLWNFVKTIRKQQNIPHITSVMVFQKLSIHQNFTLTFHVMGRKITFYPNHQKCKVMQNTLFNEENYRFFAVVFQVSGLMRFFIAFFDIYSGTIMTWQM